MALYHINGVGGQVFTFDGANNWMLWSDSATETGATADAYGVNRNDFPHNPATSPDFDSIRLEDGYTLANLHVHVEWTTPLAAAGNSIYVHIYDPSYNDLEPFQGFDLLSLGDTSADIVFTGSTPIPVGGAWITIYLTPHETITIDGPNTYIEFGDATAPQSRWGSVGWPS